MIQRILLFCLGLLCFGIIACNRSNKQSAATRDHDVYTAAPYSNTRLDTLLIGKFLTGHPGYSTYDSLVRDFYLKRDYHLAWFDRDSLTEQVGSFINMMQQNISLGLADSTLLNERLNFLYDSLSIGGGAVESEQLLQQMELMLTSQFFLFADRVWGGMAGKEAKDLEWFIPRKKMDMASLINSLLDSDQEQLESIEPLHPQYGMLRSWLKRLEKLQEEGGWDSLRIEGKAPVRGDSTAFIGQLRKRLSDLGFETAEGKDSLNRYTAEFDTILKAYRLGNGLPSKNRIDKELINDLNKPLAERIEKILINMERLRWVPAAPGDYYLLVNIPGFMLYAYENDSLMWSMPVVVGKPVHQTVIFSGALKWVVFSPYWNIPRGILKNETLPAIKRSVSYLREKNMEVVNDGKVINPWSIDWQRYNGSNFPYRIRQKPGGSNSLGRVKFLFPNQYNIYLHDTPSKSLFLEDSRSFSHGCIRVSKPKALAEYLLRSDSTWTSEKIEKAMQSNKEKYVTLKDPVTVYIGYFTAWVDSKGHLNFRPDVYGHDTKLATMLFGEQ